ncbi:MAG: tRNA (N(6)-L-threonylcarbamoyladenosine(37)-C(2))-methylthiotransferase MtaB [Bacteroidales bacterium]|nr:tRNA (N(6)-L-threonylcarbamoyladenosine(37)-C(2))-methylthiotransferase MtaB [Bacteroidales bacterium]
MKKIAFKTLGCRLNQYETDTLISQFNQGGYQIVDYSEEADVYVVNTCTVTNSSDQKSRNTINQASKQHDQALMVVTGCMVNNKKDSLGKNPRISYLVDNERKSSIYNIIDSHFKGELIDPELLEKNVFNFPLGEETSHTRSLIKIQDGCNNFCTFCIIPFVRGRAISRPVADILQNARELIQLGYKELVITGVNIGRYEYESTKFEDLVEQMLALPGDFRIRISSIEPEGFGEKLFSLLNHPKLAPQLHICLQAGSEKTLLKMRRMYTARGFKEMVDAIRQRRADVNLTTDIIVGFPGESDEDFQETLDFVQEARFSHVHTFKFSIRDGTRAARMDEQVPEKVKTSRSEQVRLLAEANKRQFRSSLIGKTQRLIIEKEGPQLSMGTGEHLIPVKLKGRFPKNSWQLVRITGIENSNDPALWGEAIDSAD